LHCTLVVPCYNEERRLNREAFAEFIPAHPEIHWIFVNDGSRDGTLRILNEVAASFPNQVEVLDQQPNQGKAEAVRQGLRKALQSGAPAVGFWDADLATPLDAIPEFLAILESRPDIDMVFGARVKLLGREIHRLAIRHYLGRIFATVVSTMLRLPIYDTQCGAKLFRNSPELASVLAEKFLSRWVFDVEIIARTMRARQFSVDSLAASIYELPLRQWKDIAGSKVKPADFMTAISEVFWIWWRYLRR
jgi:glycosyltransferase involved in cell wall biosynthesis